MDKFSHVSCRMTGEQAAKLHRLASKAGLSRGAVLRALVDAADLQPVRTQTFEPVIKSKSAVSLFQRRDGALVTTNP